MAPPSTMPGRPPSANSNSSNGLYLQNGATFNNDASASLTFLTNASVGTDGSATAFQNAGTLAQPNAVSGSSAINATFRNSGDGSVSVQGGSLYINGGVALTAAGYISTSPTAALIMAGGLTGTTRNTDLFEPLGSLSIDGPGSADSPQLLEVMSQDLGTDLTGFQGNFHYGTITLANNAYVRLLDQAQNSVNSTGPEALYVDSLAVPTGTTLDLNGLAVYTRESQIAGTVINGTIKQVVSGGPIAFGQPVPGTIATAGQVDSWNFFGRAGSEATVRVNPGDASAPAALIPYIENAQVTLLDPDGNLLATASDASPGDLLDLLGVSLPVNGVYTIQVQAEASLPLSTGHYLVTADNAVTTTQPATFDQVVNGALGSPYDINNYTFTASANQQVTFNVLAASNSTIEFTLIAPDGTTLFQHQTTSGGLLDLPQSGTYTLSADAFFGSPGAYSFRIDQSALATLTLGSTYQGTLSGSDQPQLFAVQVASFRTCWWCLPMRPPATWTSCISSSVNRRLDQTTNTGLHRLPRPATMCSSRVRRPVLGTSCSTRHSVPQPSTYTIVATTGDNFLTGFTPNLSASNAETTLTLTGCRVRPDHQRGTGRLEREILLAFPFTIDLPTQITATFSAGTLPAGTYTVEVSKPGIAPAVIPQSLTVDPAGPAIW